MLPGMRKPLASAIVARSFVPSNSRLLPEMPGFHSGSAVSAVALLPRLPL